MGCIYAESPPAAKAGKAGRMITRKPRRRSTQEISRDIRECAAIWFRRAEKLFGDHAMVGDFDHAVKCAERFGERLGDSKKLKSANPGTVAAKQMPSASAEAHRTAAG